MTTVGKARLGSALPALFGTWLCWLGLVAASRADPADTLTISAAESKDPTAPDIAAMRRAIQDLIGSFGPTYPQGPEYLRRLEALARQLGNRRDQGDEGGRLERQLADLRREALLANPLLDFDRLLVIRRGVKSPHLGLPQNYTSNSALPKTGYDDALCLLTPVRPDGALKVLFQPDGGRILADVDLHFDGRRVLFSMPGKHGRWQVCEIGIDGSGFREITGGHSDVDSYDACYLPDGRILFASTACYQGVPCVTGSADVANLYAMDADGKNIRQLTFDQDDDWCPTVLPNGRVLYLRWEYTDTPHYTTRLLFHMNPDGTEQMEYYGSNSYWPNGVFCARPIPGHATKVAGIVTGHHGVRRMGELVVFDPQRGRFEADGVVQRIPGWGKKVEPVIVDRLADESWPKFLHPFPLSEKYFLVAMQPDAGSLWGIYLVDVFDNLVLVKELGGYALFEPIPLRSTPRPPVIPPKTKIDGSQAMVYVADIYSGEGLRGVPRGTVKSLRVFAYHYAYRGVGGLLGVVGIDGPWDVKRIVGTVPVYEDGSARFHVPANTPLSIQPLDEEGKAVQLMRSWMTAMPGEVLACAGCHEGQNTAPPSRPTLALADPPAQIQPWYGPPRGFSYRREVQPVIDRHCVACHNGEKRADGHQVPDLRGTAMIDDFRIWTNQAQGLHGKFTVGYANLHRYVRRPGIESDYHLLNPMEFHADTTELVQVLSKGHYGVQLDGEAWDRLITWIDLNCPFHGTWGEDIKDCRQQARSRREFLKRYAEIDDDPETIPSTAQPRIQPVVPQPVVTPQAQPINCHDWPFDATEARRRQRAAPAALGVAAEREIELADGVRLRFALIPPGEFVMGTRKGAPDESPPARVRIERPFWMGTCEVTNRQFALFDPRHDSRVEPRNNYQFGVHGIPANRPDQPVVRVSWHQATAFCRWLSERTGEAFSLPTEEQWEYACRAGSDTSFWYGTLATDFSPFANLADAKLSQFALHPYKEDEPLPNPSKYDDWIPKDARSSDGAVIAVAPGTYRPSPWGLFDMHGNVAEWTRSSYLGYPCQSGDQRNMEPSCERKVVRGGSWRDRPYRSTSSFRLSYPAFAKLYNVGFRVVCEAAPENPTGSPGG
jgi:formylglycine-generating enzyme required for sulfatase activity